MEYRYEYVPLDHWDEAHDRPCGTHIAYSPWYPVDGNVSNITYPIQPGQEVSFHVNDLPESGYFCNGTRFDPRIQLKSFNSDNLTGNVPTSRPLYVNSWWRKVHLYLWPYWQDAYPQHPFDVYEIIYYKDNDSRFHDQFLIEDPNRTGGNLSTSLIDFDLYGKPNLTQCYPWSFTNIYTGESMNYFNDPNYTYFHYKLWPAYLDLLNYAHYLNSSETADWHRNPINEDEAILTWDCDINVYPYTMVSVMRIRLWNGTIITETQNSTNYVLGSSQGGRGHPNGTNIPANITNSTKPFDFGPIQIRRRGEQIKTESLISPALAYPATFVEKSRASLVKRFVTINNNVLPRKVHVASIQGIESKHTVRVGSRRINYTSAFVYPILLVIFSSFLALVVLIVLSDKKTYPRTIR